MKAAVYHGTADVRVEEVAKPVIGAGELLIKVKAAAISGPSAMGTRRFIRRSSSDMRLRA